MKCELDLMLEAVLVLINDIARTIGGLFVIVFICFVDTLFLLLGCD
jgi:hypothetical protein